MVVLLNKLSRSPDSSSHSWLSWTLWSVERRRWTYEKGSGNGFNLPN
ncbi:hypothetical protein HanXRQr2_Chr09g0373311 [Helianthus annuus]|uniref:Uncharacterized protein n=1 Tax=Helianthus annuus TaxID=4232 RepID=A0A9K3I3X6_HELAN|nr:hypothetical protein HanXRQr2_Chr09g0373311 [Helianthus annuus]